MASSGSGTDGCSRLNRGVNDVDEVDNGILLSCLSISQRASENVILTEDDIPGALIKEPFEMYTMHELQWWLLCQGVTVATSLKKGEIIRR